MMQRIGLRAWPWPAMAVLGAALLASAGLRADDALTVDFGEEPAAVSATAAATPAATVAAPALSPSPTRTPTSEPSIQAEAAPAAATATAASPAAGQGSDEGVVLVAPGTESPADSLATFGIESPFSGGAAQPGAIGAPGEGGGEGGLELSTGSGEGEGNISLVGPNGKGQPALDSYSVVERAGGILSEDELRVDGIISQSKDAGLLIGANDVVFLQMEQGRQVYPGSEYTVFQERGVVNDPADQTELGKLVAVLGVVKVTRVDGENVMGRVTALYQAMQPGDELVLRDVGKLRYLASLRGAGRELAGDLKGDIVCIQGHKDQAAENDIVYLDFGSRQGVVPGIEFTAYRPVKAPGEAVESGTFFSPMPSEPAGRLGLLRILSTERGTCAARVVRAVDPLEIGDEVRYR